MLPETPALPPDDRLEGPVEQLKRATAVRVARMTVQVPAGHGLLYPDPAGWDDDSSRSQPWPAAA